jgi:hypothetical protein
MSSSSYESAHERLTIVDVVALLDIAVLIVAVAALAISALPR